MESMVLTLMIFLPVAGALILLVLPGSARGALKGVATTFSALPVILGFWLWAAYDTTNGGFQFVAKVPWIPTFGIDYHVGVDGLGLVLVLLTALLGLLSIVGSFGIEKALKGYFVLFLLLETGMLGVFAALNFFLFYVFWEVVLLPMYFLIGVWGGPRKEYAAIKFFIYTLVGSVLLLIAILVFYFLSTPHTFDMTAIIAGPTYDPAFTPFLRQIVWWLLFVNFAIKVPVFPFHTWLPDAHVEAPTAVSVILAGILLKMGTYGLVRFNMQMLPAETITFAYPMAFLGVVNILYGAMCCLAQRDLKKLVAYSSVSHMGFVLLGLAAFTPAGVTGAVLQMVNHGIITGMLFLLVGVIYDRAHHRDIDGFGGIALTVPVFAGITSLGFFASLGLPGLAGFVGEVLVILGAYPVYRWTTIMGIIGIVLTAGYFLWALQRVFLGPLNPRYAALPDVTGRELFTLVPLAALSVVIGVYPQPLIDLVNETVGGVLQQIEQMRPLVAGM